MSQRRSSAAARCGDALRLQAMLKPNAMSK
jgi:hypothetical protein